MTRLGKRVYQDQLIEREDPRGIPYFWIGGPPPSGLAVPGTDFHAVVNRRIAVTPIHLDLTGRRLLKRLRTWDWSMPERQSSEPAADSPADYGRDTHGRTHEPPDRPRRVTRTDVTSGFDDLIGGLARLEATGTDGRSAVEDRIGCPCR